MIGVGPLQFSFAAPAGMPAGFAKVAVRPERMVMSHLRTACAAEGEGIIADHAWLGDISVWRVSMGDGRIVRVSRGNAEAGAVFSRGDRVFVGFDPASARVLAS